MTVHVQPSGISSLQSSSAILVENGTGIYRCSFTLPPSSFLVAWFVHAIATWSPAGNEDEASALYSSLYIGTESDSGRYVNGVGLGANYADDDEDPETPNLLTSLDLDPGDSIDGFGTVAQTGAAFLDSDFLTYAYCMTDRFVSSEDPQTIIVEAVGRGGGSTGRTLVGVLYTTGQPTIVGIDEDA